MVEGLDSDRLERVAGSVCVVDPVGTAGRRAAVNSLSPHIFLSVIPSLPIFCSHPHFFLPQCFVCTYTPLCSPTIFYALPQPSLFSHISLFSPRILHSPQNALFSSAVLHSLPKLSECPRSLCFSPTILCGASVEGMASDAALVALNGKCDLGDPKGMVLVGEVGLQHLRA